MEFFKVEDQKILHRQEVLIVASPSRETAMGYFAYDIGLDVRDKSVVKEVQGTQKIDFPIMEIPEKMRKQFTCYPRKIANGQTYVRLTLDQAHALYKNKTPYVIAPM
ncbi:hypothetical protein [Listeria booriae]|uniref:Uncharacterized protein n=1 Tax=Listeria booriae TaxID=1552123 RepID=A0A7X1CCS6_9LIST|nr:hypothetical protein [Listeria booriae]MBC1228618.1 hypothetical protein [Listeria booriae]MBC1248114.1 hypothetical protein [Listeria booriae]MBC1492740.1 hypothetical protein [Listeria booriae]